MDKTARDSIKNFEAGNGDVAITYENEVRTAQKAGLEDEMVIPPSTVLIENPVAVVDEYADKHCVREVAEAFVDFLHTARRRSSTRRRVPPADRPQGRRRATPSDFPPSRTSSRSRTWVAGTQLNDKVFGDNGIFTKRIAEAQG